MRFSEGLQSRSRQTFTKLLDATEALLEKRTFEEITIHEIAERAGSSVGAFYTRFEDKEALRECLIARYYEDMLAISTEELAPERWRGEPISSRAGAYIGAVVKTCRRRRGLMRMRFLHDIQHNEPLPEEQAEQVQRLVERLTGFFSPCVSEIDHPYAADALAFALRMVDTMVATTILLSSPRLESFPDVSDDQLVRETTRAFLRYLGVESHARRAMTRNDR
jgi:AcrR family transcriptional regulator